MAKLPTALDLGGRPEPNPSHGVAGYQVSTAGEVAAGGAMADFGQLVQHFADEEQAKQNKVRAEDATNQLGQKLIDLSVGPDGFAQKKGGQVATSPTFMKDYTAQLDEAGKKISSTLGNDAQRQAFKERFNAAKLDFQHKIITHATAENKVYQTKVDTDTVDTEIRKAGIDPANPIAAESSLLRIDDALKRRAQREGWPDVTLQDEQAKARDKVWTSRLESLRMADPAMALQTFQNIPADKMSPNVRQKLGESLFKDALPVLALQLNQAGGSVAKPADAVEVPPAEVAPVAKPAKPESNQAAVRRVDNEIMAPRGIRNNNPGNLIRSDKPWNGEVPGTDARFASFETPVAGIRAMGKTLVAYSDRGINTVQDIIHTYAPPSENNTSAYVNTVAKALGVKPTDPINVRDAKTLTTLASAIIEVENGPKGAKLITPDQISQGITAALSGKGAPADATPMQLAAADMGTATDAPSVSDLRMNPNTIDTSKWEARPDGSKKGMGFLGPLKGADGSVMTEYSIGVNINGKEMDVPTLVPTLTRAEVEQVLKGKVSDTVARKASDFAASRIDAGKSVFAGPEDSPATKQPVNVLEVALRDPKQPTGNAIVDALPLDQKIAVLDHARKLANQDMTNGRKEFMDRVNDATSAYMVTGSAPNAPTRDEFVAKFGQYEGMQKYRQFQDIAVTGQRIQGLKTMPDGDIAQLLVTAKPQPGEGFADREKTYEVLVNSANQVRQQRAADPVQYALSTGAYGIKPITDLKDPNALTAELAARTSAMPKIAGDYGTPPALLTKQESAGIASTLKAAPVDQQKQYLGAIFSGVKNMEIYKRTMGALAPDMPVIATAGIDQAMGHRMSDGRDVADLVLRGNALMNPPKREDGSNHEGGKSLIKLPKDDAMRTQFNDVVGKAYGGSAQARDLAYQRFQAIYAALSAEQGDHSGELPSGGFGGTSRAKAAAMLATGGVEKYNSAEVVMPYGMQLDKFKDGVKDRLAILAPTVVGAAPDELSKLPLENAGDGRYYVRRGSGYIVTKDGAPLVVDFNYALPPAAPYEAPTLPATKKKFEETGGGAAAGRLKVRSGGGKSASAGGLGDVVQTLLGIGNAEAADTWKPTNVAGDVKVTSGSVIPAQGQTHYADDEKAAKLAQRKAKYDALPPSVKKTIGPWDPTRM